MVICTEADFYSNILKPLNSFGFMLSGQMVRVRINNNDVGIIMTSLSECSRILFSPDEFFFTSFLNPITFFIEAKKKCLGKDKERAKVEDLNSSTFNYPCLH